MKIISGSLGGRTLKTSRGDGVRPAMARTREALFSILEARGIVWSDARVLDLFAGTGSLGFECLSRGAAKAVFADSAREVCATLRATAESFDVLDRCAIFQSDINRFLRLPVHGQFDLVFIDPPYRENLASQALARLGQLWLKPNAFVVCELEKDLEPEVPAFLDKTLMRLFGQTAIHIWNYNENSSLSGDV